MIKRFRRLFRIHSITERIVISQIIFTMIPFIIAALLAFLYLNKSIKEKYTETIIKDLDICSNSINREISLYVHKSIPLASNSHVVSGIQGAMLGDMSRIIDLQNIMHSLTIDLETTSYEIRAFTFYMEGYEGGGGSYIAPLKELQSRDSIEKVLTAEIEDIIWEPNIKTDKDGVKFISFYRNVSKPFNHIGIMQVCIAYNNIGRYVGNLNIEAKGSVVIHRNRYENIIQVNNYADKDAELIDINEDRYLWISSSKLMDESVISVGVPKVLIRKDYAVTFTVLLSLILVLCVIVIWVSNNASGRITKGLNEFINYLKENEEVLLNDQKIEIDRDDEVYFIKQRFIKLLFRISDAYKSLMDAKNQNSMLEIHLLQARINPHLLYNSLTVLKLDAMRRKDSKTVSIVDSMTNYYRAALNNGEDIIEVSKELYMVEEYMNIVNLTYLHNHKLNIDVDGDIRKAYILKHLLQPVVENAVLHGLNASGRDGNITVRGHRKGEKLIFNIMDNGIGMEKEKVDLLLTSNYSARRGGYGIKNLIKRIKLYYGEEYDVNIESNPGEGTTVTITIKMEDEKRM